MKICRECGFVKSDNYKKCPDCDVDLVDFAEYEEDWNNGIWNGTRRT